ncbi:hypothetical protein BDV25DRAFT_140450 [Aspergillus avenaceus]|uniref:Invertebrate defensins family profile domain-containing protein n=1 Tax=Aspergillus avenaceus TaxID=36643 RepID=A0A5N6TTW3_ASPAV|nr:hypothetical protein BDV25DRAFT_140450 [Aspergillus avenaceus]
MKAFSILLCLFATLAVAASGDHQEKDGSDLGFRDPTAPIHAPVIEQPEAEQEAARTEDDDEASGAQHEGDGEGDGEDDDNDEDDNDEDDDGQDDDSDEYDANYVKTRTLRLARRGKCSGGCRAHKDCKCWRTGDRCIIGICMGPALGP